MKPDERGQSQYVVEHAHGLVNVELTPMPQNGQPEDGARPQLDAAIEELLPTRVSPRCLLHRQL
jgi:hypothetical protein